VFLSGGKFTMEPKPGSDIQVVDKRRLHNADGPVSRSPVPRGRRAHSVLLGYCPEEQARALLLDHALDETTCEELMEKRERAQSRIQKLPPLDDQEPAAAPLTDKDGLPHIKRTLDHPECKAAFPEDTWSPLLVEIARIIPLQPNVDVEYAESLGDTTLDSANPAAAVKLCFTSKHTAGFELRADESQKALSITGINPALEVVGLRFSQQGETGMVLASFIISPPPNIVAITHDAGRYFLLNGYHRLYRLMQAGFTRVPCMVRDGAPYGRGFFPEEVLRAPRPPLFPDFADPALGITVPFRAVKKVVRIRPDEYFVPD
jgi:hypothetical protein